MRFTLIAIASAVALLAGCGKDPAPQVIQPGVPLGQAQVVQPQVAGDPQYQPQYQQQPQVVQAQPQVIQAQPPVVYAQPQQPVIVQAAPQHDSTGALVTGMALGALMNSGNNTTVYRDRYVATPYAGPTGPSYEQPAQRTTTITNNYAAPAQPAPPAAPAGIKPNFTPPPPAAKVAATPPAPAAKVTTPPPTVRAPAPPPTVRAPAPPPPPAVRATATPVTKASPPPPPAPAKK